MEPDDWCSADQFDVVTHKGIRELDCGQEFPSLRGQLVEIFSATAVTVDESRRSTWYVNDDCEEQLDAG